MPEDILEPDLAIIDAHHHLWDLRPLVPAFPEPRHAFIETIAGAPYYTFDQLYADLTTGHNILGTVFMECGAFYCADAELAFMPVGEVEFVNGVAAQSASGFYGTIRACAAIVGHADLLLATARHRCSNAWSRRGVAASAEFGIRLRGTPTLQRSGHRFMRGKVCSRAMNSKRALRTSAPTA